MIQNVLSLGGILGNPYVIASICAVAILALTAVFLSLRRSSSRGLDSVTPKLPAREYLTGEQVLAVLREWAKAKAEGSPASDPGPNGMRPNLSPTSPAPPRLVKDFASAVPPLSEQDELEDEKRERLWNEMVRSALRAQTLDTWSRQRRILISSSPQVTALDPKLAPKKPEREDHSRAEVAKVRG